MTILNVAVGDSIQAAIDSATPGDTINVATGTYNDQFLVIRTSLTLQATGGQVFMTADTEPTNEKAMITEGGAGLSVTINGFDISGTQVADQNGAAIRYEGGNLSLSDDYFHNNQEGILATPLPGLAGTGSITINHSEFAYNGDGSGFTHNIYIGNIANFSITNSYIHDAIIGHEIKSRAINNTIDNNRIFDNTGTASYSIDLSNGGNATISNNQIQQSSNTDNPIMITYGAEGRSNPGDTIAITSNMIVNDLAGGFFLVTPNGGSVTFNDNDIFGFTASQLPPGVNNQILDTRPTLDLTPLSFGGSTPPPTPDPPPVHGHKGDHGGGNGGGHGHGHLVLADI